VVRGWIFWQYYRLRYYHVDRQEGAGKEGRKKKDVKKYVKTKKLTSVSR